MFYIEGFGIEIHKLSSRSEREIGSISTNET